VGTNITIMEVTTMPNEVSPIAKEQIDMAVTALFYAWCTGKIGLAQFMVRLRKVRDRATEAGLIVSV
jgi:hypothetical protein